MTSTIGNFEPSNKQFLKETKGLVKYIETRFLALADRLYQIQERELWKGEYDSFGDFVDEAGLQRPFASKLIAIHKNYVIDAGIASTQLSDAGYQKLYDAIPLIEKEGVKQVVTMARTLSLSELRENIREERHGICAHEQTITICAGCHKRV